MESERTPSGPSRALPRATPAGATRGPSQPGPSQPRPIPDSLRDEVSAAPSRTREAASENGDCTECGTEVQFIDGFVRCPNGCATEPEEDSRATVRYAYASYPDQMRYQPASRAAKLKGRDPSAVPPIDRVLGALNALGCDWRGGRDVDSWVACCPTHADSRPSLVVRRNADGSVWLKCWAGCSKEGILAELGLEWRDMWEASERDFDRAKPNVKPLLPPHLRRAMQDLLKADDERRAA